MSRRIALLMLALALTSCRSGPERVRLTGVGATGDGSTLLVVISPPDVEGRRCWADLQVTATESDEVVRVAVRGRNAPGADCASQRAPQVALREPLGTRTVRDEATGHAAPLLPVLVPVASWLPDGWTVVSSAGDADRWSQHVGIANSTTGGEINLFRTGTSGDLRGSTITSPTTVQGRNAAFVKVRSFSSGSDALVMTDPTWTLMLWTFDDAMTTDVLQRLANGLINLPFAPTIEPTTIEPPASGSVAELIDSEGPANVTGWLTIDAEGFSQFCESLSSSGGCHGSAVEVDWATGNARSPDGLVMHGDRQVSDRAITLSGVLKGRIFYVGL